MKPSYFRSLIAVGFICLVPLAAADDLPDLPDPIEPPSGPNDNVRNAGRTGEVVTFESLNLEPNTILSAPDGVPMTVDGYTFTPGPNDNSGFNDSHFGNAVEFWGYNGTHVMYHHDDVIMTKEGGETFDLISFDFAGFPNDAEVTLTRHGATGERRGCVRARRPGERTWPS